MARLIRSLREKNLWRSRKGVCRNGKRDCVSLQSVISWVGEQETKVEHPQFDMKCSKIINWVLAWHYKWGIPTITFCFMYRLLKIVYKNAFSYIYTQIHIYIQIYIYAVYKTDEFYECHLPATSICISRYPNFEIQTLLIPSILGEILNLLFFWDRYCEIMVICVMLINMSLSPCLSVYSVFFIWRKKKSNNTQLRFVVVI
jgi:hypothetical protein